MKKSAQKKREITQSSVMVKDIVEKINNIRKSTKDIQSNSGASKILPQLDEAEEQGYTNEAGRSPLNICVKIARLISERFEVN